MKKVFLSVILIVVLVVPIHSHAKDDYEFAEWTSPAPYLSDYNIAPHDLIDILKSRILVVAHDPIPIKLWTEKTGKAEDYPKANFVTGLALLNASKKDVLKTLIDFKAMKTFMPQFEIFDVVAEDKKADKTRFMVKCSQSYNAIILKLKTKFLFQYDIEQDGSISKLLHQGDVGAGVMRYELFSVGPDQTILAYTVWLDTDTAGSTFGLLISAIPDFAVVTPLGNAIVELSQIKEKINGAVKKPTCALPAVPEFPTYAKGAVSRPTLQKLTDLGTIIFVEDRQWVKTEKGIEEMAFLSSMTQLNGNIDSVKPISSDFPRFREYFPHFEKVIINNDNSIDWHLKLKLIGRLGLSLYWHVTQEWSDENTIKFRSTEGEVYPMWGFWEWMPLENGNTILVFSTANKINENAPWLVRFAQKYVPNFDLTSSLFIGMLIVDKQRPWIDQQLAKR